MPMVPVQNNQEVSWFALRTRPNCEKVVSLGLRGKGFAEFLPVYQTRRRRVDRYKTVETPLFPGYVFSRFDPLARLPVLTIPGVMHIVGIAGVPVSISEEEIESLKTLVESRLSLQHWPFLGVGQQVQMIDGPLRGARGIVIACDEREKLVVSITLLQRSVAVEIERRWLRPCSSGGRSCLQSFS
jgi:transcription antitermination factor NusG